MIKGVKKISFGQRIKELLKEKGKTHEWLALETGISTTSITSWVSKDRPMKRRYDKEGDKLQRIANVLDVDVAYLECTQVEKRKSDLLYDDWEKTLSPEKLYKQSKQFEAFRSFLEVIEMTMVSSECGDAIQDENQAIIDGELITYTCSHGSEYEVQIQYQGQSRMFSSDEFEKLMQDIKNIVASMIFGFSPKVGKGEKEHE